MDLDFNSPVVFAVMSTGTLFLACSIRFLLRYPCLNIPAGLYALLLASFGPNPKAVGNGIPDTIFWIGFAVLAFWRSWRIIQDRRKAPENSERQTTRP